MQSILIQDRFWQAYSGIGAAGDVYTIFSHIFTKVNIVEWFRSFFLSVVCVLQLLVASALQSVLADILEIERSASITIFQLSMVFRIEMKQIKIYDLVLMSVDNCTQYHYSSLANRHKFQIPRQFQRFENQFFLNLHSHKIIQHLFSYAEINFRWVVISSFNILQTWSYQFSLRVLLRKFFNLYWRRFIVITGCGWCLPSERSRLLRLSQLHIHPNEYDYGFWKFSNNIFLCMDMEDYGLWARMRLDKSEINSKNIQYDSDYPKKYPSFSTNTSRFMHWSTLALSFTEYSHSTCRRRLHRTRKRIDNKISI